MFIKIISSTTVMPPLKLFRAIQTDLCYLMMVKQFFLTQDIRLTQPRNTEYSILTTTQLVQKPTIPMTSKTTSSNTYIAGKVVLTTSMGINFSSLVSEIMFTDTWWLSMEEAQYSRVIFLLQQTQDLVMFGCRFMKMRHLNSTMAQ